MSDSLKEDSSRESKEIEQNHCTVPLAVRTVQENEVRIPTEIRMRRSIHKAVGEYCGKSMLYGEFYEKAAIQYMEVNPKYSSHITVNRVETTRQQDLDDWMGELVCIQDLKDFIKLVERRSAPNSPLHRNLIKELQKILKECKKIKHRSMELDALINKVRGYFAKQDV